MIASDGDLEEGISGEASSLAGHLGLGRLISFYDQNHISIEGDTKLAFTEDVGKRYEGYGWHVQDLEENVGLDNLQKALENAIAVEDKPSLIIVRTHIAQGSPNKHDTAGAHGSPLGEEEIRLTKEHMGWPSLDPFYVPAEALDHFRRCVERGAEFEADWRERFDAYAQEHPGPASEFERIVAGKLPEGWDSEVPRFHAVGVDDRHAQVLAGGAPVGCGSGPRAGRGVGRSGAIDADADRRRRQRGGRAITRDATCTSGSASTRWARSSTG